MFFKDRLPWISITRSEPIQWAEVSAGWMLLYCHISWGSSPHALPVADAVLPARRQLWTLSPCPLGLAHRFPAGSWSWVWSLLQFFFCGPKSVSYLLFFQVALPNEQYTANHVPGVYLSMETLDRCSSVPVWEWAQECFFLRNTCILATWWLCTQLCDKGGARQLSFLSL